jgi:undecaprenyl-diphosphatase
MTLLQGALLGIIQGLTEFLPISSSGHLTLGQYFLGLGQVPLSFDVLLHMGTLLAILIFFHRELSTLSRRYLSYILLGTIPAVVIGLLLEPYIETYLKTLPSVAIGLAVTGSILLSTRLLQKKSESLTPRKSLLIGLAQALAIIPGISRSGATVSAGLYANLNPAQAFTFSFLLSIPAVVGAMVLEAVKLHDTTALFTTPAIAGFFTAVITGLMALKLLNLLIYHAKLHLFGYYCLAISFLIGLSFLI